MRAVFNSSPVIFLKHLEMLEQAFALFHENIIPEAVYRELGVKKDTAYEVIKEKLKSGSLKLNTPKLINLLSTLREKLGAGEAEAIVLALEFEGDFVILDDNAARREARRLGLSVKGTLGIIKKLSDIGSVKITSYDGLYEKLRTVNFRVRKEIFDSIMK